MEANEAMKVMARKIWADRCFGDVSGVLNGSLDDAQPMKLILAAIMETQEACAKLAEECWRPSYVKFDDGEWTPGSPYDRGAVDNATRIATAIRAGEHYALAGERHANQR